MYARWSLCVTYSDAHGHALHMQLVRNAHTNGAKSHTCRWYAVYQFTLAFNVRSWYGIDQQARLGQRQTDASDSANYPPTSS